MATETIIEEWEKISAIEQLRTVCRENNQAHGGPLEVAVMLMTGLRSTKLVDYYDNNWYVQSLIDESEEEPESDEALLKDTTLGLALSSGNLWYDREKVCEVKP
jgi:hypothetical protein